MPRLNGFQVLEWLRAHPERQSLSVAIMTSSDEDPDISRAYELGANAYMVKPMNFRAVEHLFNAITQYWGLECAKPELEVA